MSRRPARFTEADFYRAVKAVKRAGGGMAVEVTQDGRIRAVPADSAAGTGQEPGGFDQTPEIRL